MFSRLRRISSLKPALLTPNDLLASQINELQGRSDNLNAELTSVLKTGAELASSIERLEKNKANKELIERRKQQLLNTTSQRENLMKKIKSLQSQITKKQKEKANAVN